MRFGGDFSTSTRRLMSQCVSQSAARRARFSSVTSGRVLGEVALRVEAEPPRAAVRARGPVDGLEVLPLVLRNARAAKAARVGMLGQASVKERRAAAVEPPDEDEGLAVERARHTGTRTCRRARRSSFVDGSGSGTRAISR